MSLVRFITYIYEDDKDYEFVFFSTLAEAWHWNLPTEAILTTLSAVELFLGAIFGISKVIYDRKENPEKDL